MRSVSKETFRKLKMTSSLRRVCSPISLGAYLLSSSKVQTNVLGAVHSDDIEQLATVSGLHAQSFLQGPAPGCQRICLGHQLPILKVNMEAYHLSFFILI